MNKQLIPLAALLFTVAACSPKPADELAPQANRGGSTQPVDRSPPQAGGSGSEATQPSSRSGATVLPGEYVGKFVVDSNGERLGEVRRIVRDRDNNRTLAVISIADTDKEVLVPVTELEKGTQLTNLNLRMTREELGAQPDAGESDYVEIRQDMNLESEAHLRS